VLQVVREEPVPPSRLSPRIPRDLETICLKCLRKDPAKRYARASELADDLRRFLHGEPITARPVSKLERFWKLLKRHPAISGGTFMIGVALIAVTTVVAFKNRQLGLERDNALRAEQEALAEQQKNQRLVDLAIDQQERLIARITSVDWTGNRAIVAERERILQDVAEFYKQLLRQEVDDPIVRRKNAEAHVRLALVQIHRSDYRAAADSIQLAKQSLEQLSESFAEDPDTISALAKTETAVGHLWMLQGELLIGSEHYHRAVELAEKAVSIRPDREDDKMLLMECYLSLVQYYSQTDTANATLYSDKISALSSGIDLNQKPSYQSRLIFLAGLFQKAQSLSLKRDFSKAVKVLDEASAILEKLLLEDAPSVRSREITEQFAASLLASRGILRLRTDKSESAKKEAVGHLQDSVARYDRALAGNPKSIPFQIARLNALLQYAVVQEQIGDTAGAVKTHQLLDAAAKKMQSDHPKMVWLNNIAAVSRSVLLVNQSNESTLENFEAKAKAILDIKESEPQMSSAKYNVACAYSLASKKVSEQDKERYQAKAVEILETIRVAGYFSIPNRVADIKKDTDFDPIRARDDFKTVLKKVAGEK
jgi:tetratricopeptide (TPR) repeat protein